MVFFFDPLETGFASFFAPFAAGADFFVTFPLAINSNTKIFGKFFTDDGYLKDKGKIVKLLSAWKILHDFPKHHIFGIPAIFNGLSC